MLNQGLVWVVALSGLFWAEAATANISGTVADQAGARLSRVEIVVTCIDNGRVWSVHTDKSGRFTAPNLPLGEYVLGAFSDPFMTATRGVRLEDGKEKVVNFTLKLEKPAEPREAQGGKTVDSPALSTKMEPSGTQAKVSPPSVEPSPARPLVSASPESGGFAVQIAAYQIRRKAEGLRAILKDGGYSAYVVEADVPELGRHYRVRIGPFDTRIKAKEVASEVRRRFPQEGPDFWIVPSP